MSTHLHILNRKSSSNYAAMQEFQGDVLTGLSQTKKQLHSKYFYDAEGSELFNKISRHPDYYLTRCEFQILNAYKKQLSRLVAHDPFNLIELGSGEGIKTRILIEQFLHDTLNFTYIPIDISLDAIKKLANEFNQALPNLELDAINSDYFQGLQWLVKKNHHRRNIVLFLGSSIGNFDIPTTKVFLQHLWQLLNNNDYVLIGFDMRKDIPILMRAYNDSDGITREFNLNLLKRINRELGANFNPNKFSHYETYNVYLGAMESYLISLADQTIDIEKLKQSFAFQPFEPIHVEYSFKYLLPQIAELAQATQFEIIQTFTDAEQTFVDSLWQVKK